MTPVQGIINIGLFLKKARVTAVTDSLDLLTHGFTFTLPSCRILWTHWKRSLASARKQAKINKYFFLSFFSFFLNRMKTMRGCGLERNPLLSHA